MEVVHLERYNPSTIIAAPTREERVASPKSIDAYRTVVKMVVSYKIGIRNHKGKCNKYVAPNQRWIHVPQLITSHNLEGHGLFFGSETHRVHSSESDIVC